MKRISIAGAALCLVLSAIASAAETQPVLPKPPEYAFTKPLYFRIAFGREGKDSKSMLGVLHQAHGAALGYSTAYVDENMDNDLTNDAPKEFPWEKVGPLGLTKAYQPQFTFEGPVGDARAAAGKVARYRIILIGVGGSIPVPEVCAMYCTVEVDNWEFRWLGGKIRFYGTPAEALKGPPSRFGAPVAWEISSSVEEKQVIISAAVKDKNDARLRLAVRPSGLEPPEPASEVGLRTVDPANFITPRITLSRDGETVVDEKLAFG
jgi:hypothetical protein